MTSWVPEWEDVKEQPIYLQIADSLAKRILSGELAVGERLPSERQLAEELGVSRMTVRQALLALRRSGLVQSRRGQGSFVSGPKLEQPVDILTGFSDNILAKGMKPGARVLSAEQRLASQSVARSLGLPVGEPVWRLHRLRLADNMPAALEISYFPARLFPDLNRHDLEGRSVYAILAEEYGVRLAWARQCLEPTVARPEEASLLGIPVGAPLMLVERTTFDETERIVEFAKDLYRGDCFRFVSCSKVAAR